MSNPSLEKNYVIVCKYYAFEHLSCDIFGDVIVFLSISGKIPHVASFNPIWRHIARFSKKDRECSEYIRTGADWFMHWLDYFWVSYDNQGEKITFE